MSQSRDFTMMILGVGRLGTAIRNAAESAGVQTVVFDGASLRRGVVTDRIRSGPGGARVLIDASMGEAAVRHVGWAMELESPLVLGTTGHGLTRRQLEDRVEARVGVLMAPNFAPGALLLGRITEAIGAWSRTAGYSAFLEERHHARKKDAPSGTAAWLESRFHAGGGGELPITATRSGAVAGTHLLGLTGAGELLEMRHMSLGREVYGAGAVAAAAYILGKRGVHSLEDWAREMFPWPATTIDDEE
jgi:4-hydroxy-tetrahydrodipicolinate reductase